MKLSIHTIATSKTINRKRKRIGRGNASGHGTYSGRGQKGQNARAGVSNLKRLGMKQVLLRTPKKRGFTSLKPKKQVVNLTRLNEAFKEKAIVSPESLLKKGLIATLNKKVKILGQGTLIINKLTFKDVSVSASAAEQIEKSGGKIVK